MTIVIGHQEGVGEEQLAGHAQSGLIARPADCTYKSGDWEILSKHWYPIARLDDIGDQPVIAQLLDVELVIYRTATGLHITRNQCPHRGVPLSMGWVDGEEIVCAYHGLRFATDGRCTKIPAQPQVFPSERFRIPALPAVERYGLLWTCFDATVARSSIPPFPEWSSPAFQQIACPPLAIEAAPGRQLEGFIDVAHFAWVHDAAFADRENSAVPAYKTQETDFGFRSEYISDVSNFPRAMRHLEPENFIWRRTFDVYPPFVAFLRVDFPNDGVLRIMNIASPISARRTRLFVPLVRNFDVTGDVEDVYAFNAQIFAEDQVIVEAQRPRDLPLDLEEEVHFAADKSSVAYRRALRAMGLS